MTAKLYAISTGEYSDYTIHFIAEYVGDKPIEEALRGVKQTIADAGHSGLTDPAATAAAHGFRVVETEEWWVEWASDKEEFQNLGTRVSFQPPH